MAERKSTQPSRISGLAVCLGFAGAVMAAAPAVAFQPTLSSAEVKAAIDEGVRQEAAADHGFLVGDYVLFDRPDPLRIDKEDHPVDAIIVGTPREQLLYLSYMNAFQRKPISEQDAAQAAQKLANTVRFRVFAHGPSAQDQDKGFINKFSPAEFKLDNGTTLTGNVSEIFGPGQDFFTTGDKTGHAQRWLGAFSYVFDLNDMAKAGTDIKGLKGTLSFTDGAGYRYSYPVDLSKYT
jgi:hypothetical protein